MERFEPSEVLQRLPQQFFAKLTQRARYMQAAGHDVINLGQGNPDQPTPGHIVEALQTAASKSAYHGYSPFRGYSFLKEAAAAFYEREYQLTLDPETEVAVLFGGKTGLVEISQCLLNPGDIALVPDPGYPDYWSGIAMAGGRMEMMPLLAENQFLPDYDRISDEVWRQAKLLFLNYPNNPTSAVADADFFADTVARAASNRVCVVHDFAYGAIGFDGVRPPSFMQTPGAKDVGIEIYTLSKTYNMAGWRVGFAVGNKQIIEWLNLMQDHYYCSLFGGIQEAAAQALLGPQDCVEQMRRLYEARRDVWVAGLRSIGWQVEAPKGSFFGWFPVPAGYTSESFADLLSEQAHIIVAPGVGFGQHGQGYVRIGLLSSEERLLEAVERIDRLKLFD